MEAKEQVLKAMREAGQPVNAGKGNDRPGPQNRRQGI